MEKLKGAAYLRVSGRGQIDRGGFARQRDAIRAYADANGIELVAEYRDEGVSGKHELADRKGLATLLDRIEHNGVSLVLVESADRLARKLMVQETILEQFRAVGVGVYDSHGTDLSNDEDPTRILIRQVLGAVSQFDRHVIVLKLRASRERKKRETGRCEGRKAYGFYEGETEILALIRRLRRKPRGERKRRRSWRTIATVLNRKGVPTRMGGEWRPATLMRIAKRNGIGVLS